MIDTRFIDDTVKRISEAMPTGARRIQEDVERNVRAVLGSTLSRLDLVNRDEFEIQKGVLQRSREKIEALEQRVAELETMLTAQAADATKGEDAPRK
jgi:ubiquinone biosynthesis accessory factor UbiK